MKTHTADDPPVRARIPADLDMADQVMAGLTARQVLTLAVLAAPLWLGWRLLAGAIPVPVLLMLSCAVLAVGLAAVMVRRDGLTLDRWLAAAFRHARRARQIAASIDLTTAPGPELRAAGRSLPAPLAGITDEGILIRADGTHVCVIACTMITNTLATHQDDAILAAGMAQWLNSLSGPVQILVQARPADLVWMATDLAARSARLANPRLAAVALDHAESLLDIYESVRPLNRTALIACSGGISSGNEQVMRLARDLFRGLLRRRRAEGNTQGAGLPVSPRASAEARSRAQRSAAELEALGARTAILDGRQVRDVLAGSWTPCLLPDHLAGAEFAEYPLTETVAALPEGWADEWEGSPPSVFVVEEEFDDGWEAGEREEPLRPGDRTRWEHPVLTVGDEPGGLAEKRLFEPIRPSTSPARRSPASKKD